MRDNVLRMSVFERKPYAAVQGVAADRQRLAMHLHTRGFHGLSAFEEARLKARMGRGRLPRLLTPTQQAQQAAHLAKHDQAKARHLEQRKRHHASAMASRTRAIRTHKGLGDFYNNDPLAGSFDGLGGAYGKRIRVKARRGQPLTTPERKWMKKITPGRGRLRKRGPLRMGPPVGLGDAFEGLGAKSKRPSLGKNLAGGFKVARGMIGFKKGLSASQIKKARVARKIGVVVGATILTAGAASAIAGSVGAAGAAGSAAGAAGSAGSAGTAASGAGLFSKLIGKAPQAMDMVKRARKAFNLPALTAGTFLKKGSPRAVAAGEELDAANKASDAVKNGTMTQEQADEYLANAIRNSEARARDAEARLEAERRRKQEAGEAASARQAEEQAVAGTPPSKPEEAGIGAGKAGLVVAAVLLAILAGSKGKPLTAKAAR